MIFIPCLEEGELSFLTCQASVRTLTPNCSGLDLSKIFAGFSTGTSAVQHLRTAIQTWNKPLVLTVAKQEIALVCLH